MDFLVSQICDRSRAAGEYGDEDDMVATTIIGGFVTVFFFLSKWLAID